MANTVQIKRGNTASVSSYTGPSGEVIYNTDTNRLHSQDGSVPGGHPHALMSDVNTKANSSVTISAGTGLTGGGNLTANRTVSLNAASIASLAKADSAVQTVNGVAPTGGNVTVAAEEKRLQDTRTTAMAESFPSNFLFVETAGYSSVGDGGGALYKRVSSEPSHAGKFQSADGAWWELASDVLTPEMFGAIGDEFTDDTDAFRKMLTYTVSRVFRPDPAKRYHITGQLDLGRSSEWDADLNLRVTGSRSAPGASMGVQTGGGSQHLTVLFAQGKHRGKGINVYVETHPTTPWLAIFGNDFYLHADGTRPAYPTQVEFDDVEIRASSWVAGYSGDGNSCIRFQGMDMVRIDRLTIKNFQIVSRSHDVTDVIMGGEFAIIDTATSGIQFTAVRRGKIGDVFFDGYTTSPEYTAGANSLIMRGVVDLVVGDVVVNNAGEHGVRLTSSYAIPDLHGILKEDIFTSAMFGHVKVFRPGGCGFKAASGDTQEGVLAPIKLISLASLYVEDAGREDYSSGGTFTGQNHFGLNLQNVEYFSCPSYVTTRKSGGHNGRNFALWRDVENINIGVITADGCYEDGIFWNVGTTLKYNIYVGSGIMADYGRSGVGSMLRVINPQNAGRVDINIDAHNAPSLFLFTGLDGEPPSFWKVKTTHFNITDFAPPANRLARRLIVSSPGSLSMSSDKTSGFTAGDTLLCQGEGGAASTLRNQLCDVYISSTNSRGFIAVKKGENPPPEAGALLSGSWIACGQVTENLAVLVKCIG